MSVYLETRPSHIENKLSWIKYQLREDFGKNLCEGEIWWLIYNDVDRCGELALDAVMTIADDRKSLEAFAKSIMERGQHTVHIVTEPITTGRMQFLIISSLLLGFVGGLLIGVTL